MKRRRTLRLETEAGPAAARWERVGAVWSCVAADWPVRWLVGMEAGAARVALLRMRARWEWVKE